MAIAGTIVLVVVAIIISVAWIYGWRRPPMETGKLVFYFWKDNQIAGMFQLTPEQVINEFNAWLPTKEKAWLEYCGISVCIKTFISEHLNSTGGITKDNFASDLLEALLKPIINTHIMEGEPDVENKSAGQR